VVKKLYCYCEGGRLTLTHNIPQYGTKYVEKTISSIGVPYLRAVSIKNSDGILLYNSIEHIPLEDNFIERYLIGVDKNDKNNN